MGREESGRRGRRTALSAVDHTSVAKTGVSNEAKAGLDVPLQRGKALSESAGGDGVGVASGVCQVEEEEESVRDEKRRKKKERTGPLGAVELRRSSGDDRKRGGGVGGRGSRRGRVVGNDGSGSGSSPGLREVDVETGLSSALFVAVAVARPLALLGGLDLASRGNLVRSPCKKRREGKSVSIRLGKLRRERRKERKDAQHSPP
jgi:hypothetical protein